MKTQTSRDSFRPAARISGVYLQQGRMIVDADWNEATDVGKARLESALRDAIASGAPRTFGLKIDNPGGGGPLIHRGALYVDGIPARLDAPDAGLAPTAQPDYRNAPAFPAASVKLYADVWDRPFTALEDLPSLDPGLHGADTATRTRTMLQVKWCDAGKDPMDPAVNPPIGNAKLRLRLRQIVNERDCCDPCAAEVEVDEHVGDYQFRCEVHDVLDDGSVVLKWSRDNGAEAYTPAAFPQGFDQGDWTWEYFDTDSENLLGHHFRAAGDPPMRRGVLQSPWSVPANPQPNAFVRQWDGYAIINPAGGGALVGGRDRNTDLSTTLDADAHAYVRFDGDGAHLNLDLVELHLSLTDAQWVPGDYWQATVREAIHASGDWILGELAGEPPKGILHHYLLLAELDAAGNLVAQTDAQRRQMTFPPLTDLRAIDVGFTSHCDGLFAGAQNVQAALDALCGIGAEDIAYTMPQCPTDPSIRTLMAATLPNFPNLDGVDPNPSVKDILDAFLCHLDATRLPVVKANLCDDLKNNASVVSVQDALDALCKRPGGGCEVSVPVGKLREILEAFQADPNRMDLSLCLLPGVHELTGAPDIKGKNSLRIHAASPEASSILLKETQWAIHAQEIGFDRVYVRAEYGAALRLVGKRVGASGCIFQRHSGGASDTPLVRIDSLSSGLPPTIDWRGNVMFETWTRRGWLGDRLMQPGIIANPKFFNAIKAVFERDAEVADFTLAMKEAVDAVGEMTLEERKALATVMDREIATATGKLAAPASAGTNRAPRKSTAKKATTKRASATGRATRAANTAVAAGAALVRVPAETATRERFTNVAAIRYDTSVVPKVEHDSFADELKRTNLANDKLHGALFTDVVALGFESGYNVALALSSTGCDITLADNRIEGEVLLMNGLERGATGIDPEPRVYYVDPGLEIQAGRGSFFAHGNQIVRLWSLVPVNNVDDEGRLYRQIPGLRTVVLGNNTLVEDGQSLVATSINITGLHVLSGGESREPLLRLVSRRLAATTISSEQDYGDMIMVRYSARGGTAATWSACHLLFGEFMA